MINKDVDPLHVPSRVAIKISMRLRLTIWRHGLPPASILWSLAPPLVTGASYTISQLLEQVNESIPLEAGDWGLEDYTVEVEGFECLHYADVSHLLKDDDNVHIRPLQTTDLRVRKVSGRHQITEDGKHLIDGVPFGRPLLRRPNRPTIHIPPRKRRRLVHEENTLDATDGQTSSQQLLIQSGLENGDNKDGDADEDEEDFPSQDEEGLDDELQHLRADSTECGLAADLVDSRSLSRRRTRSATLLDGLGLLPLADADGTSFSRLYHNPLLDKYEKSSASNRPSNLQVRKRGHSKDTQFSRGAMRGNSQDSSASVSPEAIRRRESLGSSKSVRFDDGGGETPATERLDENSDDENDSDFSPDQSNKSIDESDKENAPPHLESEKVGDKALDPPNISSSGSSDVHPSDSDYTSSSGTSSDDESTDSEQNELCHGIPESQGAFSDSPSSSEPASDSESDNSSKHDLRIDESDADSTSTSSSSDTGSNCSPHKDRTEEEISPNTSFDEVQSTRLERSPQPEVLPYTGKKTTQNRNWRRQRGALRKKLISQGVLPTDATLQQVEQWKRSQDANPTQKRSDDVQRDDLDIEAKRKALLKSIESDDGEADGDQKRGHTASVLPEDESFTLLGDDMQSAGKLETTVGQSNTSHQVKQSTDPAIVQVPDSLKDARESSHSDQQNVPPKPEDQVGTSASPPEASRVVDSANATNQSAQSPKARRSKLDLASSRRFLFGSLGVRAPRNRKEESDVEAKLMSGVKYNAPAGNRTQSEQTGLTTSDVQDESWRDKIELRAVECCYDGIELSTPPFPFVQRWDPQQQRNYGMASSKRKAKKRKRNNDNYYENHYDDSYNEYADTKSPRRQDFEPATTEPQFEDGDQEEFHAEGSLANNGQDAQAANEQLLRESLDSFETSSGEPNESDLPSLPSDLSSYQTLTKEACKFGNIIAFKKLEMSLENGWQPKISDHRVAKIEKLHEDGMVELRWATRDLSKQSRRYNNETGERIYGRFEMPGYDDEYEHVDPSKDCIDFAEMIEPLLIKAAKVDQSAQAREDTVPESLQLSSHEVDEVDAYENTPKAASSQQSQNSKGSSPFPSHSDEILKEPVGHDLDLIESGENGNTPSRRDSEQSLLAKPVDNSLSSISPQPLRATQLIREAISRAHVADADSPTEVPSTQTRNDISKMFRDAHWRSSIGSDIQRPLDLPQNPSIVAEDQGYEKSMDVDQSPNLPKSSHSSVQDNDMRSSVTPATEESILVETSILLSSSIEKRANENDTTVDLKTDDSVGYPALPHPDEESELLASDRQHRSVSFVDTNSQRSPSMISPPSLRGRAKQTSPSPMQSQKPLFQKSHINGAFDGTAESSSDELPTLFSQKFEDRLSQGPFFKPESPEDNRSSSALKRIPKAKSRKTGVAGSSQRLEKTKRTSESQSNADSSFGCLRQSRIPESSQVVDLTISSDPMEQIEDMMEQNDVSHKPSSSMPTGSGWVEKRKKNRALQKVGTERRKSKV
ncbi:uncharacterized protein KY384_001424 [Bacidia gigantensis]|uniref:uncharacterized protein n=1 Tax=Bacidia gigantensis TaxID=2732470 RepID=UPI001D051A7E|nr:uncharacterized protein KY384_001424 [Bacidia gigantensis]KAG8533683.1 hypothetical protein KY384_001424 [Bacidia gigantensis]